MKYRIDLIWKEQAGTTKTIEITPLKEIETIGCHIATLGITQKKVILFEVSGEVKIPSLDKKKFRGVEIQVIDSGLNKYLSVILLEPSLYNIFLLLGDDLLSNVAKANGEKDAIGSIFETINDWRKLFERSKIDGLSVEQQKGLYGELLMIKLLLKHGVNVRYVLNAWTGPDAKNNDFEFTPLSIEVKTTTANQPSLSIANEHQLTNSNRLFLVLFVLSERRGSTNTLPALIEDLKKQIVLYDSELKDFFVEKLQNAGYYDIHRENYEGSEYSTKQINCYYVDDKFPRIVPDNVKNGIFSITYKIELSACTSQLIQFTDLIIQLSTDEGSI
jgi:hypothetical protein